MKIAIGVAAAGFLGAVVRYGVGFAFPQSANSAAFPWATTFINLTGSLLLGLLTGWVAGKLVASWLADVAGTGFLGAYTTFSAFNGQLWHMLDRQAYGTAAAYALVSAVAGWALAALGLALGRKRAKRE